MNGLIQHLATLYDIGLVYLNIINIEIYSKSGFNFTYEGSKIRFGEKYKFLCLGGVNQESLSGCLWCVKSFSIDAVNAIVTIDDDYYWNGGITPSPWRLDFYTVGHSIYPRMLNINTQNTSPWGYEEWLGIVCK